MTALVAVVALAGCAKNDNVAVEETSVFVQITNGLETKALGDAVGTTPIVFTDGFLFFADGSGVITKRSVIGASGDMTVTELKAGKAITGVPTSSTQVFVVGNIPAGLTVPAAGNISYVKDLVITVASQADGAAKVDKVTLYGAGAVSGTSATLAVKPIASRVEVARITGGGTIQTYKVAGVFINNYYPNSKLDGTISASGALVNNANTVANYVGGAGQYPSTLPLYDYNAGGLPTMSGLICAPAGKVWAYNVMAPSDAAAVAPRVIIRLTDVVLNNGYAYTADQFLTVKLYNGATLIPKLDAGKAYNIANIAFTEANLTGEPETATISVTVTITMTDWTTVTVTPVL